MKPYLEPVPLTDEDFRILTDHRGDAIRAYAMGTLWVRSRQQDRLDAGLMSWAQTIRRVRADGYRMLGVLNDRVSVADPNPIDYGGDISRFVR